MKRWWMAGVGVLWMIGCVVVFLLQAASAQVTTDNFEVMLLIDTSGSMRGAPIDLAKQAATSFVDRLPGVRIGVESFGTAVDVLTAPTADHEAVKAHIASLTVGGNTHLHDALITGAQSFTPAGLNKTIVLLSDGGDEGSTASLEDAVAASQGVHIEAISLTTSKTDLGALQRLGTVTSADDPSALTGTFNRVADQLTQVVATTPPTTVAPTTVAPTTAAPTTSVAAAPPTTVATTIPAPTTVPLPKAPDGVSSLGLWLGAGGVFVAIFALVSFAFPRVRVKRQRLGLEQQSALTNISQRTSKALDDVLERYGKRRTLSTNLAVAGVGMRSGEFAALVLASATVAMLLGLALFGPVAALIGAGIVLLGARALVNHKVRRRQVAFSAQLPDVIQSLVTTLRTGYGLTQAFDAVAEETEEPARTEFAHVLVETRLGRDLTECLNGLAHRMDSVDLEWMASAIDIHRETGGNLAEILDNVGTTIRERQRMKRQIKAMTAEGRLSAYILTALPLGLAGVLALIHPGYFSEMGSGGGLVVLIAAGVFLAIGNAWIRKMVNIKV
jgi:tight adherence protein B